MLWHKIQGAGASRGSVSFIASASNASNDNTATVTAPVDIEAGDLLIYSQYVPNYSSGSDPSGFTNLVLTEIAAVDHRTGYKIASGSEGGTTITGMTGSDHAVIMLVFRPTFSASVSTGTWNSEGSDDVDPASQTVTPPTANPVVVLYAVGSRDGAQTFSSQSPSFDGTVSVNNGSAESLLIGYSVYNSNASEHTADVGNLGTRGTFHSGYVELTKV